MNSESDKRFYALAFKALVKSCTPEEEAELQEILEREPERRKDLTDLHTDATVAREILPLVAATEATGVKPPDVARERVWAKVQQHYGRTTRLSRKERDSGKNIDIPPKNPGNPPPSSPPPPSPPPPPPSQTGWSFTRIMVSAILSGFMLFIVLPLSCTTSHEEGVWPFNRTVTSPDLLAVLFWGCMWTMMIFSVAHMTRRKR